jgi:hypothetical protein
MMKKLIATLALVPILAFAAGETKKVCNTQKDKKGKETQVCKDVRVHKKLDGVTKVPPK